MKLGCHIPSSHNNPGIGEEALLSSLRRSLFPRRGGSSLARVSDGKDARKRRAGGSERPNEGDKSVPH